MGSNVKILNDLEIQMSRVFDAPRELVFEAHTKAEHLKHWWGRGNPMSIELDFREGGKYRFVEIADGIEHGFRGEYREIAAPDKLVYTFEYEGMPGHICVETLEFAEEDGKTILTNTTSFDNKEDRDGMLASGMEEGAEQSLKALDNYLETLKVKKNA